MTTPRRHLRDAATICPATAPCPGRPFRCELDAGHTGPHRDGCSRWPNTEPTTPAPAAG
ncbi:hypothetical protein [Streptomyces sp. f150]|uniref:hypothetical protein n=1 Tax=Streptomyces sp. f150 TaxID=1827699 RepID=UPI0015CEF580|nr:hypothetical protein [Streptomyces sp. f150]